MRRSFAISAGLLVLGCQASEAPRVELAVVVDGSRLSAESTTTALGWTIELSEARLVLTDLRFTTAGEVHDDDERSPSPAWTSTLLGSLIRSAHAHPGHYQGGEIIGELPGEYVLDFIAGDGEELGVATLIVGEYTAANFGLGRGTAALLDGGDPLIEHTAILAGTATSGADPAEVVAFSIVIDSPLDREIVGAPFDYEVREDQPATLAFRLLATDPFEGDHLFDSLDFAALDAADGELDGAVTLIDPDRDPELAPALADAYYDVRRDFQTHDFFEVVAREP